MADVAVHVKVDHFVHQEVDHPPRGATTKIEVPRSFQWVDLAGKTDGEGASNELFTGKASREILDDGYCRVVTEVFATEGTARRSLEERRGRNAGRFLHP